jgi:hypothetical protein
LRPMLQGQGLSLGGGMGRQQVDSKAPHCRLEGSVDVFIVINDEYAREPSVGGVEGCRTGHVSGG